VLTKGGVPPVAGNIGVGPAGKGDTPVPKADGKPLYGCGKECRTTKIGREGITIGAEPNDGSRLL
jgi:hypothetical protein